jgi:hypothetical protein
MNANAADLPADRTRYLTAILLAGLIAGSLDLTFAFTFYGVMSGATPIRILQTIATGWLGLDALKDGLPAAALGFVSHYGILIGASALYLIAMLRMRWMTAHAYFYGIAYGVMIYAFMHLVVLPLSNAPQFKPTVLSAAADFSMHVLVIGPAIALTLKRFAKE